MLHILKELESHSGRNDKEAILKKLSEKEAKAFKYIAFLTYDPSINFYTKAFNTNVDQHVGCVTLSQALYDLQNTIATRLITGKKAKTWIEQQYEMLSEDDAEVFKRIVKRDLKCGISESTINKIFPGTVYEEKYMRCSSFSEKNMKNISFPCLSQTKMDGLYVDIIVRDRQVQYVTRGGSYLNIGGILNSIIPQKINNTVFNCEVVALNDDKETYMDRSKSNGYVNSSRVDPERLVFIIWDTISTDEYDAKKSDREYQERLDVTKDAVHLVNHKRFKLVENKVCNNADDVIEHFKENREKGEEGTVVKDYCGKWKAGTSKHQIKVKIIFDCELKLVGWKKGSEDSKHKNTFGSLIFESSDGLLEVAPGIGYKDDERPFIFMELEKMIEQGAVATIAGNDIAESDSKPGMKSIFLPRFIEFRSDKLEADSLDRIQEQLNSCLDILKKMEK